MKMGDEMQGPPGEAGSQASATGMGGVAGEQPIGVGSVGSLGELADLGAMVPGVSGDIDVISASEVHPSDAPA